MDKNKVFYYIDNFSMLVGPQASGFNFALPSEIAVALARLPVTKEHQLQCLKFIRGRIARADSLKDIYTKNCGVVFYRDSALPSSVIQDSLGGSLGFYHQEIEELLDENLEAQYKPSVLTYHPHNVDTPGQAITLLLIWQAWAEWATAMLRMSHLNSPRDS